MSGPSVLERSKKPSDPRLSELAKLTESLLWAIWEYEAKMLEKPNATENRLLGRIIEKAKQFERAIELLAEKLPKPPEPPRPPPWELFEGEVCSVCDDLTNPDKRTVSFVEFHDEHDDDRRLHICPKCLEDARLTLEHGNPEPEAST